MVAITKRSREVAQLMIPLNAERMIDHAVARFREELTGEAHRVRASAGERMLNEAHVREAIRYVESCDFDMFLERWEVAV